MAYYIVAVRSSPRWIGVDQMQKGWKYERNCVWGGVGRLGTRYLVANNVSCWKHDVMARIETEPFHIVSQYRDDFKYYLYP